ncbi:MAG: glutamine amidotransferase, partial [bacterium]
YRQFTVFRSEAGLQAPPPVEDIFKFLSKGKIFPPSDEWSYHLADAGKIAMYAKQYGNLSDLENFVKKAQLAQSLTYQFNLDSCLKNIWRNSGCLIWQFNDPWPNISWSMVDWYGNPKPSLYWFKKASSPLNIAVDYDKPILRAGDQLNINLYGVNLTKKKEVCEAIFLIASPRRILQRFVKKAILQPQSAEKLWSIDFQLTKNYKGGALFLLARLVKAEKLIADKVYPIPVVRAGEALKPPVKVLAILSSIGQEAEGWREIASLLLPFGIEFDISTPDSLPDLAKYACFVIGESEGIGGRLKRIDMERIGELVRSGKGLLLDGGWNAYAEGGLKGTIIEEISPFVFKEGSLRQDLNLRIIKGEGEHPILQGLSFSSITISGYNEEEVRNGAKILLSLSNGSPLLAEVEWGKGRCLAYTSGLRGGWAGGIKAWDRYPLFLARLFLYLAHRENEIGNLREEAGGLDDMPSANLRIERRRKGKIEIMRVKNCSAQIAFFLRIKADGLKVQPIFSDNYFTLLPGEGREVVYEIPRMGGKVLVEDW